MFNEPRNWKWMVPGILWVLFWVGAAWLWVAEWNWSALTCAGIGLVLLTATVINAWAYTEAHAGKVFAEIQYSRNRTPVVMMFEYASRMHPDAVAALLTYQRIMWRVRYVPVKDMVDWVIDEAPSVHLGFLEYVLDYSSDASVMPKSMLSDGSKQFDPDGMMTDYEQYDSLIMLLQQKMMCTQAFGNQAPKWIPPWTPELLRRRFGIVEGEYYAEGTEMLKAVERAREAVAGNGADPLRAVKAQIQADALDGLEQTVQMQRNYQSKIN